MSQQSILQMKISLGNLHKLSAEGKSGYYGISMLCGTTASCSTGPDLIILDIVKPFFLITRSEVTLVSQECDQLLVVC